MNPYYEQVERLMIGAECIDAMKRLSTAGINARQARGRRLAPEKLEELLWGLRHDHPVVRRRCLELLDLHPERTAIPHILERLDDPVPRVRWHAVHALVCDTCKLGESYLDEEVIGRLRRVAERDPSSRVRDYARRELEMHGGGGNLTDDRTGIR